MRSSKKSLPRKLRLRKSSRSRQWFFDKGAFGRLYLFGTCGRTHRYARHTFPDPVGVGLFWLTFPLPVGVLILPGARALRLSVVVHGEYLRVTR